MNRQEILDRAMTRAPFPGTRRLTAGILSLARQLGLQWAVGTDKKRDLTDAEKEAEGIALGWLLDTDNTIAAIRSAMTHGPQFVLDEILPDYAMTLHPLKLANAQREYLLTSQEMSAGEYDIEPKPDEKPGDKPSGN